MKVWRWPALGLLQLLLLTDVNAISSPGSLCDVDSDCLSNICRDGVYGSKICCKFSAGTDCAVCEGYPIGIADLGDCLSYGRCNDDSDCASNTCRQGHLLREGEKVCCKSTRQPGDETCLVCTDHGDGIGNLFNVDKGGVCLSLDIGEECFVDAACKSGNCLRKQCCGDVGPSCLICDDEGECINNRCENCKNGEACIEGFGDGPDGYESDFGCCKVEELDRCVTGCDLNGDCVVNEVEGATLGSSEILSLSIGLSVTGVVLLAICVLCVRAHRPPQVSTPPAVAAPQLPQGVIVPEIAVAEKAERKPVPTPKAMMVPLGEKSGRDLAVADVVKPKDLEQSL